MEILWQTLAWEDYLHWQATDEKTLQKINILIGDCLKNPFSGKGKPEPLKGKYAGLRSRRIAGEHRLVYAVKNKYIHILQCRYHFDP